MVRPLNKERCTSVYLELWDVPIENFGKFIQQVGFAIVFLLPSSAGFSQNGLIKQSLSIFSQVPAPLGIGTVDIDDGTQVKGFICEAWVGEAAAANEPNVVDITHLGNWLTFAEQQQQQ